MVLWLFSSFVDLITEKSQKSRSYAFKFIVLCNQLSKIQGKLSGVRNCRLPIDNKLRHWLWSISICKWKLNQVNLLILFNQSHTRWLELDSEKQRVHLCVFLSPQPLWLPISIFVPPLSLLCFLILPCLPSSHSHFLLYPPVFYYQAPVILLDIKEYTSTEQLWAIKKNRFIPAPLRVQLSRCIEMRWGGREWSSLWATEAQTREVKIVDIVVLFLDGHLTCSHTHRVRRVTHSVWAATNVCLYMQTQMMAILIHTFHTFAHMSTQPCNLSLCALSQVLLLSKHEPLRCELALPRPQI